ncbi:hypothetical protein KVR01_006702 [Diaporthe batatas]|uniref:uncharacterized protein n=1 Tax=Diaporthe batatas TaxID=748121 RepID=UPI001D059D51|nr:uncharacterized protein KVR01_006702 [Diaporthe batatas]KAG8163405.1 hypothetical protein KVR01_006702 [Diaporthe batatas]
MDAEKNGLPPYSAVAGSPEQPWLQQGRRHVRRSRAVRLMALSFLAFIVYAQWRQIPASPNGDSQGVSLNGLSISKLQADLAVCSKLRTKPSDPIGLGRERNARYIDGHKPTLIRNAKVWVGEPVEGTSPEAARAGQGWEWIDADVFLEHGLIKEVGKDIALANLPKDTITWDAKGRQLTAGVIDMHSHSGVDSLPELRGNSDVNEMSSDITPYVRSIDGIQPTDHQIQVIKSGGVTTSLVLPGSGNNIGGEAYVIKHAVGKPDGREEISAEDMLADPDRNWRYMKMACGENAKRVYGKVGERGPVSRLGESWEFRHAFEQAAKVNREQDDWCNAADALGVENMHSYLPQDLKWESLAAALRGQVHINTHCYTIPDLEAMVDHTNEFQFPVRAFHHAHQTFLVPEILKRTWGGRPPASAIFATNMYYKAEAYIGSEYAGKVLYEEGLTPVYVSDNPVLNAQHVIFEAAKGYKFGLPYHAALAGVTSEPADLLGLGKRLGKIKPGYDADVVVWDSDPLSVGATPVQVWIDGTSQWDDPVELKKPVTAPLVPDSALNKTNEETAQLKDVLFTGVSKVLLSGYDKVASSEETFTVAVSGGKITCFGPCEAELHSATTAGTKVIHLKNGYLTDSFIAFGSTIGLNEIDAESSTDDGDNSDVFSRAADGLALDNKKLKVAHEFGVTRAITAPKFAGGSNVARQGVSVGFSTGARTALDEGAVWADDVAVHYTLSLAAKRGKTPSISSAVGAFRRKLLDALNSTEEAKDSYSEEAYLKKVVAGDLPLVVTVHSADAIASILKVKQVVEKEGAKLRLSIIGGAESWILAHDLAAAGVGVVLAPADSYASEWDQRRALSGAPLTNGTAIDKLIDAGVVTAIGLEEDWIIRDLALLAGRAYRNGEGRLSEKDALALISTNVYKMLGIEVPKAKQGHFIVSEGSPLEIGSRVKAVGGGLGRVSVFE